MRGRCTADSPLQRAPQSEGAAVPTRGDARTTLPKARARRVVARLAHQAGGCAVEGDVHAATLGHADGAPRRTFHGRTLLLQRYRDQPWAGAVDRPRSEQTVGNVRGTRSACFGARQLDLAAAAVHFEAFIRELRSARLCRPDAPNAPDGMTRDRIRVFGCAQLGRDGQGIGVALVQLGQRQVVRRDGCERLPTQLGVVAARQGQKVELTGCQFSVPLVWAVGGIEGLQRRRQMGQPSNWVALSALLRGRGAVRVHVLIRPASHRHAVRPHGQPATARTQSHRVRGNRAVRWC